MNSLLKNPTTSVLEALSLSVREAKAQVQETQRSLVNIRERQTAFSAQVKAAHDLIVQLEEKRPALIRAVADGQQSESVLDDHRDQLQRARLDAGAAEELLAAVAKSLSQAELDLSKSAEKVRGSRRKFFNALAQQMRDELPADTRQFFIRYLATTNFLTDSPYVDFVGNLNSLLSNFNRENIKAEQRKIEAEYFET